MARVWYMYVVVVVALGLVASAACRVNDTAEQRDLRRRMFTPRVQIDALTLFFHIVFGLVLAGATAVATLCVAAGCFCLCSRRLAPSTPKTQTVVPHV